MVEIPFSVPFVPNRSAWWWRKDWIVYRPTNAPSSLQLVEFYCNYMNVCGCTRAQNSKKYGVTFHTYLGRAGQLSYTPSIEHIVGWMCSELNNRWNIAFFILNILAIIDYVMPRKVMYQALTIFLYCKQWKLGGSMVVQGAQCPIVLCQAAISLGIGTVLAVKHRQITLNLWPIILMPALLVESSYCACYCTWPQGMYACTVQ